MSYGELFACSIYAEQVIEFCQLHNNGEKPKNQTEAEYYTMEYNNCFSFEKMFGLSIKYYLDEIINCIGLIVEQ